MAALERTVRDLNASLQATRSERAKTVKAHQQRIKHLQEKFIKDLEAASTKNVYFFTNDSRDLRFKP